MPTIPQASVFKLNPCTRKPREGMSARHSRANDENPPDARWSSIVTIRLYLELVPIS